MVSDFQDCRREARAALSVRIWHESDRSDVINFYGPSDNYDLNNSHVVAALLRRIREAKVTNARVGVWGSTGAPRSAYRASLV